MPEDKLKLDIILKHCDELLSSRGELAVNKNILEGFSVCKIEYSFYVDGVPGEKKYVFDNGLKAQGEPYTFHRNYSKHYMLVIKFYRSTDALLSEDELVRYRLLVSTYISKISYNFSTSFINELIYTDLHTGVYNITYYFEHIEDLIANNEISNYSVLQINIRNCRKFDKMFGNNITDIAIKELAKTIASHADANDNECVAAFGGDNFSMLVKKDKVDKVTSILKEVPIKFNYESDTVTFPLETRIGIVNCDSTYSSPQMIISNAFNALSLTNINHTSKVVYSTESGNILYDKLSYISDIKKDMGSDKFIVYFQPLFKVTPDGKTITGSEALIRWAHNGKIINPSAFIPVIEETGLISKNDFFVLNQVCSKLKEWTESGIKVVPVSCNFSHKNIAIPSLAKDIISTIDKHGISRDLILIEFTELSYNENYKALKKCINELHEAGVKVCLDDYGQGATSIHLLSHLDFDYLKIDGNLVNSNNEDDIRTIESIIELARKFNHKIICEGVSDIEHAEKLMELGVSIFQADIFDKALSERFYKTRLNRNA